VSRWAVILAGGVGSRFWPLSTPARPKQLLPLVTDTPLLADTVARLAPLVPAERTLVITNASLASSVGKLLPSLPAENIIAEPRSAGTAPALTWAALEVARRDGSGAIMICVHADWAIGDADGFRKALDAAATVAESSGSLVTVGVVPARPDPGFGYIRPAEEARGGARRVAQFIEKPDRATAEALVAAGCLWNSGIFVWGAGDFLTEVRLHCPEVTKALPHSDPDEIAAFFAACTPISVDHGVLERSRRVLVLPGDFGWDDVGTWAALHRVRAKDAAGNAVAGDVHLLDARENVVHAEGQTVVAYGVEGLVIVARDGVTLVTTRERAADLKTLLDALPPAVRDRK
jgi:mannose-1-phosphate guanylyltransferase